jgi:hypothetical protein
MAVFSLAYRSRSLIQGLTAESLGELTSLLHAARERNTSLNVTGALIFTEGLFAQILEGEQSAVSQIVQSIQKDHRHTEMCILPSEHYEQRRFQKWSMAFVGPTLGARAYYKQFSLKNGFEWTQASAGALVDLMLDLIAIERALPPSGAIRH